MPDARPVEEPPTADRPRERSRRRMVTGIFTALFSRRREQAEEEGFDRPQGVTPAIQEAAKQAIHDARLPRVTLFWETGQLEAGVKSLSGARAVLRAHGHGPAVEEDVVLNPIDGGDEVAGLDLGGRVRAWVEGKGEHGDEYTLELDPPDDADQAERLTAWIRYVNGPDVG
ncbi:MAG: hypothetical protein EP329_11715 [Deltaproteobacteria bacterium]|nr:MAG: hypothetical protein EP329_11715 [Deltaproteobacteria bacterium]